MAAGPSRSQCTKLVRQLQTNALLLVLFFSSLVFPPCRGAHMDETSKTPINQRGPPSRDCAAQRRLNTDKVAPPARSSAEGNGARALPHDSRVWRLRERERGELELELPRVVAPLRFEAFPTSARCHNPEDFT